MTSEDSLCVILSSERVKDHYDDAKTDLLNSNEILDEHLMNKIYIEDGEPYGPTIYSSKHFVFY